MAAAPNGHLIHRARDIVAAYVSNNHVSPAQLPDLIATIHASLTALPAGVPAVIAGAEIEKPTPAQIRKSISPDALISFIDGKPFKTLKRHLKTHGLDPTSYRERFGLPFDYPMVAPAYSQMRTDLATSFGLGRGGRSVEDAQPAPKKRKKVA